MRVEFPQGVPEGCTQWLREHVGIGNIEQEGARTQQWMTNIPEYGWFYERVATYTSDSNLRYVPTITVKDPELATLFVLRWSS